jgi:transposase-like protein
VQDAYATARHFGITAKTLYKWLKWFDHGHVNHLEEHSRAPNHVRQWEVTLVEYNSVRPHESLDYLTPMEYIEKHLNQTHQIDESLLPMYSARTLD